MGESLVVAVKNQQNVTTKLAHVHEQSEFTYDGYLVAAEHLSPVHVPKRRLRAAARFRGRA